MNSLKTYLNLFLTYNTLLYIILIYSYSTIFKDIAMQLTILIKLLDIKKCGITDRCALAGGLINQERILRIQKKMVLTTFFTAQSSIFLYRYHCQFHSNYSSNFSCLSKRETHSSASPQNDPQPAEATKHGPEGSVRSLNFSRRSTPGNETRRADVGRNSETTQESLRNG